jgi:NADH-quinone oxidoreductase chain G
MNSLKYFYINNQKFNYTLEFQNNQINNYWKHNAPLIEYCETLGITIPHYCYHKNLSISGNCRMCLVELKNSPKPMVSCAMSAKSCLNNTEIFTNSPLVKKAREKILEFLLLNHPLDCPICDQGGECDLQDQSLYFGTSKKRFYNFKRIVTDKNIGPVVKTVMTRCIHCTRCVRFSTEIAGTEDLGIFGRGLDSEIGTYVTKTFQSELSGNVIDLCPVGALTQKPYPFLSRSWELKTANSVDFADGFGTNTQVFFKNSQIVKITSDYNTNSNNNPWISDKSRFSFDGMFSPARILKGLINFGSKNSIVSSSWKILLTEIITTLYFQDHLNKHFLKNNKLIIIFSNNISLEVLNLIYLFSKKYSFIKLRKFESQITNTDFESEFLTHSSKNLTTQLSNSNLCFLISLYSRYEGVNLNLKLRHRYLKGNFKILTLGSNKDLTFPSYSMGSNIKNLKTLIEGNSYFCQDFITSKNPIINISSSNFYRKDSDGILKLLNIFKKILSNYHSNWNNLNVLNTSLNETGVNYLNTFKSISETDLNSSSGLYFLNIQPNPLTFQKLTKIKLLNYLNSDSNWPTFCLEQNFGMKTNDLQFLNSFYKPFNYINLPNGSFFESTGTFLNTEGDIKKTIKFISTEYQTKEDWQIVRKIFSNSTNVTFLTNCVKNNSTIFINTTSLNRFKSFTNYIFFATSNLTNNVEFNSTNKAKRKKLNISFKFKNSKVKLFSTKVKIWLNDFYIGGTDSFSRHSTTMINCSKMLRLEKTNFSHLV